VHIPRSFLIIFLSVFFATSAQGARKGTIGTKDMIGLGLGGGTMVNGVTGKIFLSRSDSIQAIAGIGKWGVSFGGGYVRQMGTLWKGPAGRCFWSVGLDASVLLYDEKPSTFHLLSLSGVLELGWHTRKVPLEIVLDYRPSFFIGERQQGLKFNVAGAAMRWFF